MRRDQFILICLVFLFLILGPYLYKANGSGENYIFGGFLLNPIDGNSYLAKMMIGQNKGWEFSLPFSPSSGEGEYLFLFYIFLGHMARILGLENIVVFHAARVLSAILFLFVLNRFIKNIFPSDQILSSQAFVLTIFGSGLGWLFSFTGHLFSDFWVAEAYPFLASYTSPHFTLGLALLLMIFLRTFQNKQAFQFRGLIYGILISIIMPFGFVVAAFVLFFHKMWKWKRTGEISLWEIYELTPGGLFLVYQYYVTLSNPSLSGWNAQNITAAPHIWDLLISFSPGLIFALFAMKKFLNSENESKKMILIWLVGGIILIYLPFSLQRRFMFGLYIPVAIMAIQGIKEVINRFGVSGKFIFPIVIFVSFLTNLFLIFSGLMTPAVENSRLFISTQEKNTLQWIRDYTSENSLILCSPEMGLLVPAYTGRKVLYGHPFETLNADSEEKAVLDFYSSGNDREFQKEFILNREIDYIIYGNREAEIGYPVLLNQLKIEYQNRKEFIYAAHSQ